MSLSNAGKIFAITVLDGTAGMLTGSLIEMVSPPITTQGPIRIFVEAMLQLGALVYLSSEVAKMINRVQDDPTGGVPYLWCVLFSNPSTITKIGLSGQVLRSFFRTTISQQTLLSEQAAAEVPK
jgi:hypothetical protein